MPPVWRCGSRDGRERARHFRCLCIDRDEPAGDGFAEGHIEARAVGTEIQRAALEPVVRAAARARRLPCRRCGSCRASASVASSSATGQPGSTLPSRKVERERLPALRRLAARYVQAIALPVDDRRGENAVGMPSSRTGSSLQGIAELRAPENRSRGRAAVLEAFTA